MVCFGRDEQPLDVSSAIPIVDQVKNFAGTALMVDSICRWGGRAREVVDLDRKFRQQVSVNEPD